jgi:hypothetical protein
VCPFNWQKRQLALYFHYDFCPQRSAISGACGFAASLRDCCDAENRKGTRRTQSVA